MKPKATSALLTAGVGDDAAVEAEEADIDGGGERRAVAIKDGAACGPLMSLLNVRPFVISGWMAVGVPGDEPGGIALGKGEVSGVFEDAEIGCSQLDGEGRSAFLGRGDGGLEAVWWSRWRRIVVGGERGKRCSALRSRIEER